MVIAEDGDRQLWAAVDRQAVSAGLRGCSERLRYVTVGPGSTPPQGAFGCLGSVSPGPWSSARGIQLNSARASLGRWGLGIPGPQGFSVSSGVYGSWGDGFWGLLGSAKFGQCLRHKVRRRLASRVWGRSLVSLGGVVTEVLGRPMLRLSRALPNFCRPARGLLQSCVTPGWRDLTP